MRLHSRYIVHVALWIILSLGTLSYSQTPYTWLPTTKPTTNDLKSTFFIDSLTGWVGGKTGVMFKTTDGGKNWIEQITGVNGDIDEIFFLDHQHGWALGVKQRLQPLEWYGTYFLSTENGGATWSSTTFEYQLFYALTFLDTQTGWIGGDQGILMGTTNGGREWFNAVIESSAVSTRPIKKVKFYSPTFGIAVGGTSEFRAVFRRTTNGGVSWKLFLTGNDVLNDLHFIDSLHIIAVGGGVDEGTIVGASNDAGVTWSTFMAGYLGVAGAVGFRTPNEAFAPLLYARSYIHSLDSGITWDKYATPNNGNMTDVFFPDSRHGYMVGDSGIVYTYNASHIINVSQNWNIISIPVSAPTNDLTALFPTASSWAFSFGENGYLSNDSLFTKIGYWLKFPSSQSIEIEGFPVNQDSIPINSGWNMIGSISEPVTVSNLTTYPGTITLSPFYEYNNGYTLASTLQPGKGYWVKSDGNGYIIMSAP